MKRSTLWIAAVLCYALSASATIAQSISAAPVQAGTGLQLNAGVMNLQPSGAAIGGVNSLTCAAHQWLYTISVAGLPACAQPSFSDLSGVAAPAQLPTATASAQGAIPAWPNTATSYFRGDGTYQPLNFPALGGQATLAQLPNLSADSVYMNENAAPAVPTSVAVPNCTGALTYSTSTHAWGCNTTPGTGTVTSAAVAGGGGETTSGPCSSTTVLNCVVLSPGGHLNKFRNGTFDVAQRGIQTISTSPKYGLDGWLVSFTGTGGISVSQGAAYGPGSRYAMYMAGVAGNTDLATGQHIESWVAAPMAGQTVTVQVGFYQTTGAPVALKVSSCYATAPDNFASCTVDLAVTSMQSCASSTYCVESYTFNVNANAINGYNVTFDCGAVVASQFCLLQNADIRVTPGVATGLNNNPPPPELRNIAEETLFCQRYLNTSYTTGNAPGAATTAGMVQVGVSISGGLISAANVRFPTTMRAAPTLTFWDGAGNSGKISYTPSNSGTFTNNLTNTSAGAVNISANGFDFIASVASTTANYWSHYVASAEL